MINQDNINVIQFLSEFAPISKELKEVILEHSGIKKMRKGDILLREGQIAKECFFILKGCVKKYFIKDGEEKITGFYTEGHVVTPASYTNQEPSKYYLSTLEETIGLFGNPEDEKEAMEKHPELLVFIGTVTQKIIANMEDEFDDWMSHSPEDRYLLLSKKRPDLIQRVPQYQIASYIGIKAESLSRIRKRLSK